MAGDLNYSVGIDVRAESATRGSASLRQLSSSLKTAKGNLSSFQSQLSRAKALGDIAGYRKYSSLVDEAKRRVFDLSQATEGLSAASLNSAGGIAGITSALGPLAGGLKYVYGLELAAAAGLAALTYEAVKFAAHSVNARNQAVTAFGAFNGAGEKTLAMVDTLSKRLPQSRETISGWAKDFMALGVTDLGQLKGQVLATASAQALLGDTGAAAYQKIQRKIQTAVETHQGLKIAGARLSELAKTGANVADVAEAMGLKTEDLAKQLKAGTANAQAFGNALESSLIKKGRRPLQGLFDDLGVLETKAGDLTESLFKDIDIKPMTTELRGFIGLLDEGKPSGQALKVTITSAMNAIIRGIGHGIHWARSFFLDIEIGALKAYIAMKPLLRAFGLDFMAKGPHTSNDSKLQKFDVGLEKTAAIAAAGTVGGAIANGLTGGMFSGLGAVRAAGALLGMAAIEGAKRATDSHSPSRVAIRIGGYVGAGVGIGMRERIPAVRREGSRLGISATAGVRSGAIRPAIRAQREAHSGSGPSLTIGHLVVQVDAPHGVTNATDITVHGLALAFERARLMVGR